MRHGFCESKDIKTEYVRRTETEIFKGEITIARRKSWGFFVLNGHINYRKTRPKQHPQGIGPRKKSYTQVRPQIFPEAL